MLAYLFLRIDYASGYDPPGSKFTRIDFFVTPAAGGGSDVCDGRRADQYVGLGAVPGRKCVQ